MASLPPTMLIFTGLQAKSKPILLPAMRKRTHCDDMHHNKYNKVRILTLETATEPGELPTYGLQKVYAPVVTHISHPYSARQRRKYPHIVHRRSKLPESKTSQVTIHHRSQNLASLAPTPVQTAEDQQAAFEREVVAQAAQLHQQRIDELKSKLVSLEEVTEKLWTAIQGTGPSLDIPAAWECDSPSILTTIWDSLRTMLEHETASVFTSPVDVLELDANYISEALVRLLAWGYKGRSIELLASTGWQYQPIAGLVEALKGMPFELPSNLVAKLEMICLALLDFDKQHIEVQEAAAAAAAAEEAAAAAAEQASTLR